MKIQAKGSAIILAIFIVAMVAALATRLVIRQQHAINNTRVSLNYNQAYSDVQGVEPWAKRVLLSPAKQQPEAMLDKLPQVIDYQTEIGQVSGKLIDLQGRFNINNLAAQGYQHFFYRLLRNTHPNLTDDACEKLIEAIIAWLKPQQATSWLDEYYRKLQPPYRAAHRPMVSVSELKLIKGMTPEIYAAIEPYLIALPESTPININAAAEMILMSISPDISAHTIQAIVADRAKEPFGKTTDFLKRYKINLLDVPENALTVSSSYFMAVATMQMSDYNFSLISILQRTQKDKRARVKTLWQSFGAL